MAAGSRSDTPGYVLIDPLNGAIRDTAPDDTAFPWRRHAASLQWLVESPADPIAARRWVTDAHRALDTATAGGYANYAEPETPPERYFADNLHRVRIIGRVVDPDRRLRSGLGF
ncbi:hypothetical protein HLB23_05965 [Nocardia uniformis]|uniref:Uncharacterized protein n=1 Tax=Nocardia uniformis TaxID=53432 RepID=A0A849BWB7_9NOCA|nr:hypothetical protein [Nocardia uniformis]NNH69418.1 hypothetical protein [Nocardia uniformis]